MTQTRLPRHRKWHNIDRSAPATEPQPTVAAAFARREVTSTLSWQAGTGAQSNAATVMFRWQDYETAEGVYSATIENALTASIDDAHTKGYAIVLRVFAGADAPVGRPSDAGFPSWMLSGAHAVTTYATTKANDSGGGVTEGDLIHVPYAGDTNYRYHYQRLLQRLAALLDDTDIGGHPRRQHVLHIPAAMPTELGTEMTLGYGQVDPTFNRAAWDVIANESTRRGVYKQAWKDTLDDHATYLPNVRRGLAGGHVFNDGWLAADEVIQEKASFQVVAMTTSLKDNYPTTNPNDHDYMTKAAAAGCYVGIQTAGESAQPQGQSLVDACEFALSTYGIRFLETYTGAFTSTTTFATSASGGWPGGTVTMKTYLVNHASDLQSRLVT